MLEHPNSQVTGIVHLGDLAKYYVWDEPQLPRYLKWLGLPIEQEQIRSVLPPKRLVVFCHCTQLQLLSKFRLWMSSCSNVYFWISFEDSPELWQDTTQRRQLTLGAAKQVSDVALSCLRHFNEKFASSQVEELGAMLNGTGIYSSQFSQSENFPLNPEPVVSQTQFTAGPWCRLEKHSFEDPVVSWPRQISCFEGRPCLLLPQHDQLLRLDNGTLESCSCSTLANLAASITTGKEGDVSPQTIPKFSNLIGLWPNQPNDSFQLAWAGGRCVFDWLLIRSGQIGHLSGCEHDWPCGHEKKQYGFLDNEPCWIQLSRDANCYLSVYQKDAIVNDRVPVSWRRCGSHWAAIREPVSSLNRALFFCHDQTDNWEGDPLDASDGDARMIRPAIVLGPDYNFRYALDLSKPVYRIQDKTSQLVSGAPTRTPETNGIGHFGVYSAEHQLRRIGSGRLLGGWDRWLTVLRAGQLRREEIDTGKNTPLGAAEREIDWAFSLPASANVVLVHEQEEFIEVRLT